MLAKLARPACLLIACCLFGLGCQTVRVPAVVAPVDAPRELAKVTLPPYVVEPPDVLIINVVRWPLAKDANGKATGAVLTSEDPIRLTPQPIEGTHLIRPDGTINLGVYGSVQVAGLTLDQIRENITGFLAQWFEDSPKAFLVIVDVAAYNSKTFYIITDGAGYGEQVYRFPIVGSETVLDAISQINGLPAVASKRHVWVARRSPAAGPESNPDCVMPVNWCAITQYGDTRTNYQMMPGDRLYVKAQPLITTSNWIQKALAPVQELLGVTLLGSETVNSLRGRTP
ncbi:MAG: polysaccharide biosynthesis/export family protein [Gemmataceae bacterium]